LAQNLPEGIGLLEESLEQLSQGTNISAANWFMQAISKLSMPCPLG
jgi:hypothetical protein